MLLPRSVILADLPRRSYDKRPLQPVQRVSDRPLVWGGRCCRSNRRREEPAPCLVRQGDHTHREPDCGSLYVHGQNPVRRRQRLRDAATALLPPRLPFCAAAASDDDASGPHRFPQRRDFSPISSSPPPYVAVVPLVPVLAVI